MTQTVCDICGLVCGDGHDNGVRAAHVLGSALFEQGCLIDICDNCHNGLNCGDGLQGCLRVTLVEALRRKLGVEIEANCHASS